MQSYSFAGVQMQRSMRSLVLVLALPLGACAGDEGTDDGDSQADGSSGGESVDGTTSASNSGASQTSAGPGSATTPGTSETGDGSSGGEDTGSGSNDQGLVRFVAIGDAGEGNDTQFMVADAVEQVCAELGCDFALYLGDNFYDVGVTSTMDQQFTDKFEMPYMDISFPFYITLGNHDYGTLANEWEKSQYQIDYSEFSDKWTLPSEFYAFEVEHVKFVSLDTSRIFWDHETAAQATMIQQELANTEAAWRIAFGHHPYISNGEHGNAGNYEGVAIDPIGGGHVKEFFDAEVCGKFTVYFSGHDHNRQWLLPACGTEFIVSGAGAKNTDFAHRDDNPVRWEDDQKAGFAWVEIQDKIMTVIFYDSTGTIDYEDVLMLP